MLVMEIQKENNSQLFVYYICFANFYIQHKNELNIFIEFTALNLFHRR
jgi:hypothetical protein